MLEQESHVVPEFKAKKVDVTKAPKIQVALNRGAKAAYATYKVNDAVLLLCILLLMTTAGGLHKLVSVLSLHYYIRWAPVCTACWLTATGTLHM